MSEAKRGRKGRPMIPVIRITNPFDPRQFVREEITWQRKKTLDAYFPVVESAPVVVSINGKVIPNERFGMTYLDKTDNVVVCPVPTGGGNGKMILKIVALIAVSVITAGAGAAVAGAMMGTNAIGFAAAYGSLGVAFANGVVTMAGAMLVNAVFAPPKHTIPKSETSSTYGVDGAKNTSLEGVPVPVNYGQFRMAGNILGLYVDNVADDNQILYMLISAGEGPVGSITDVQINDNPMSDYGTNIEVQTRLGLPNQTAIPWFSDVVVPINNGNKLTTDWTYQTTTTKVDKLRLDFTAPSGLFEMDGGSGATKNMTVPMEAEYRVAGSSGDWTPFVDTNQIAYWKEISARKMNNSETGIETWVDQNGAEIVDPDTIGYLDSNAPVQTVDIADMSFKFRKPVYQAAMSMSAAKKSAVRRSFMSAVLDNNKYEIRVRRTTPKSTDDKVMDEVYLSDVNEIVLQELTYPNTALVALKITLGTQISGVPRVTFMHGGRLIQVYGSQTDGADKKWYTAASSNPAWVVWDMLTNKRFGGAMPTSRIDFLAFQEWADYCDEKGLQWNGPIDSEMNVWDACQLALRVGHAQLVNVGTRYTVVVEKPSAPVMMFSVANMIEGSYKETWLGTNDRANEIDVTFFDKTDNYKQRTVKVVDPAAITAGAKQRTSAITLYGVTDYETAYKEGQFQLNLNRYILRTVEFSAPLEAVACSVGDLIYVQHDMTQWAQAGRFDAGSTKSVMQLDRPVTMEAGKQYKLLAMHDAVQRAQGSVVSVVGTSLFLQGYYGDTPVKRIQINGRDLAVAGTFNQGNGYYGVILDDATGIAPGQSFTLWDTDVVEEYDVVNHPGDSFAVTLQSPMTEAPAQFCNWMFGEADKVKQTFRVKAVSGSHEYRRDITAIEYKPEVYDFSRYGTNVPVLPPSDAVISPVQALSLYEETYVSGSSIVSSVVASWAPPAAGLYAGADVYVKKNDGPLVKLVDAKNVTSAVIDAAKGDVVTVTVQSYDLFSKRSQFELAPSETYTVIGEVANIDVGGVTGAGFTWSGRDCKINWRYNSVTHSYEFGSEPNGGDAGALDPHFKDYEIRVYEANRTTLRRTEYTTDNSYVYIYDKNFADGLARHLVFEIRMRDIFNNLGEPATLDAYNPPPTITSVANTSTFESATIAYEHSGDPDFAGAVVWLSQSQSVVTAAGVGDPCQVYSGPDTAVLLPNLMFAADYYYKIAAYDAFGMTELVPSAVQHFKTTNLNVNAIADGVLSDSKLLPVLQTRINQIDAPSTGLIDRLSAEIQNRADAITAEAKARADAIAAEAKARTDAITAEADARAQAILAEAAARGADITTVNKKIQDTNDSLASTKTTLTASINANASAITTEQTARVAADTALSSLITTLASKVDGNTAAITTEQTTRAAADSALSSSITALTSKVDTNTAAITTEQTTRAAADTALSSLITTLASKVDGNTAAITTEQTTRAAADSALSSSITSLSSKVDANAATLTTEQTTRAAADSALTSSITNLTAQVNANAAAITSESKARSDADSATATQITALTADYKAADSAALTSAQSYVQNYAYSKAAIDSSEAAQAASLKTAWQSDDATNLASAKSYVQSYAYSKSSTDSSIAASASALRTEYQSGDATTLTSAQSYVQNYAYSKTAADSSTASTLSTLRAEYKAGDSGMLTSAQSYAQSYVQGYAYSKAAADSAIATSVNTVSARLNNAAGTGVTVEQAFSAQATTNSGLLGQYTVKVDAKGYVAGFGLASTVKNGVPTSEFIINADKFAVVTGGGSVHPFTIGTVDGLTRTIISNALIGDASISTAKIGNAQVNTFKIGGNSVTVPVTAQGTSAVYGAGLSSFTNILSMNVYMPAAGYLYAHSVFQQAYGTGTRKWNCYLQIDGNILFSAGGESVADTVSMAGSLYVGAGNHTVVVAWGGEDTGVRVLNRNLFALAAMR